MPAPRWLAAADSKEGQSLFRIACPLAVVCAVSTLVACGHAAPPPYRPEHKEGQSLFRFAAPLDSRGYLAVADALAARLSSLWDARGGYYRAGSGTVTEVNADLLLVHSAAAVAGRRGAARDDVRAVRIARFFDGRADLAGCGTYKINPDGGRMSFNAGHTPAQAWVYRGHLYVAARDEHRVLVLDLEDGEQLDEIDVEPNPTAFGSDGRSLWVTGLAKDTVSRIVAG